MIVDIYDLITGHTDSRLTTTLLSFRLRSSDVGHEMLVVLSVWFKFLESPVLATIQMILPFLSAKMAMQITQDGSLKTRIRLTMSSYCFSILDSIDIDTRRVSYVLPDYNLQSWSKRYVCDPHLTTGYG
ncbi:hypothetical protein RRG08_047430 [Elysia crispata]|uniref:Uncharacterized protein n=1 Tax=Elysia crispata TaxID=231223 RepID=A0AAE0YU48_9GAST|nr:hypothetical protein RRG08_047430 [Elysia crispata]